VDAYLTVLIFKYEAIVFLFSSDQIVSMRADPFIPCMGIEQCAYQDPDLAPLAITG